MKEKLGGGGGEGRGERENSRKIERAIERKRQWKTIIKPKNIQALHMIMYCILCILFNITSIKRYIIYYIEYI